MTDSMLSQDEVDALFKQATGKSIVHTPSSAPSEKPVARPASAPASAPVQAAPPPPVRVQAAPSPVPAPQPVAPHMAPAARPPAPPAPAASPAMFTAQEIRPKPAMQPPLPAPAFSQAHNDAVINQLEDLVSELTIRLARAERRLGELEQSKRTPPGGAFPRELARLNAQMENMRLKLEATPGSNARSLFTCSSCGTSGQIAVPIKCTHCGEEGWWGWWPKGDTQE